MSGTALKLFALILMLIDHVGEFFPGTPVVLRWIGRLSAPVFLFCAMWGFRYTHDRAAHLHRLYLCAAGMGVGNALLNGLFPAARVPISNNFFATILLSCLVAWLIERLGQNHAAGTRAVALFLFAQAGSILLCRWLGGRGFYDARALAAALLPNCLYNEGGLVWVLLGVALYFSQTNRRALIAVYSGFCLYFFLLAVSNGLSAGYAFGTDVFGRSLGVYLLRWNFQWMMAASLPFLLGYNGKRGRGFKRFFYLFYPAHIYLLFLLSLPAGGAFF